MINLINIIKLGYLSRSSFVKIQYSKKNFVFIKFLFNQGFIKHYTIKNQYILIFLRYIYNKPLIQNIKFISKKGYRRYVTYKNLKSLDLIHGTNTLILSTSKGYLIHSDALKYKIQDKK